jgi:hypothetical protein
MAKKKSSKANRKHQFKYATPATGASAPATATAGSGASVVAAAGSERDFSYVISDLRRTALLGGGLIVFQIVLWYLFNHTGLGPSVYNFVKV